jgi:hypothetical protein
MAARVPRTPRLLRVVALELQVGLERRVEADVVVAPDLDLVDHLDLVLAHEDEQLVDLLGIDELVGQAGVQLLVADPATAYAVLDQLAEDRRCEFEGVDVHAHCVLLRPESVAEERRPNNALTAVAS